MDEFTLIAVDTSKHVFTLHAVRADGGVLRRELRRQQFLAFFERVAPTDVALEACGGAHHWGRELVARGHQVRLLPPQYVRPFVRRSKNDRADAEAIAAAATRPEINAVPVKSAEQQAGAMLLKVRELLVRQETQLVNAFRGHAAEFGCTAATGPAGFARLQGQVAAAEDAQVPAKAKQSFACLSEMIAWLRRQLGSIEKVLQQEHRADPDSRRLSAIPGIGTINGLALSRLVDWQQFRSARHFAAWLGLVPREHSTGGKQRLGGISRAGNERLRALLVNGATAVIRHAASKAGRPGLFGWLEALLKRKPRKLAAVALANKMARIAWAMMARGQTYRQQPAV